MSGDRLKVLILGGYGTFGGRLARLLDDEPRVTLVIAGRSLAKAERCCAALEGSARKEPAAIDRNADVGARLKAAAPDVVVDATGPFQVYGEHPYRVVEAALAAGAHYLDLADGSAFVRNIVQFDAAARAAGRSVLSGVSSFPVLTAAVVRHLATDLATVESIASGIAPSPYAGVGENVIRAIASYAGQPIDLRRDGRWTTAYPLTQTVRYTIAPPGVVPLQPTEFSLVDVPDLVLLVDLWPGVKTVWVGAGPVPAVLHRLLRWLAHGVRLRLIPSLAPLAALMHRASNTLRWGEHRGGMFVEIEGKTPDGRAVRRSWHMVAEGDAGPFIPSMAVEAIVRNMLIGRTPLPGARAATLELEIADYERAFARHAIVSGARGSVPPDGQSLLSDAPLFQRVLGDAWWRLPPSVRELHASARTSTVVGTAMVITGRNWLARAACRLLSFPAATANTPLRVTFERAGGREIWRREFGPQRMTSVLYEGGGRFERLLCERVGPLVFGVALAIEGGRLSYIVRRWSFLGIPLPRALAPLGTTFEYDDCGRFHFDVEIDAPVVGPIVRYAGQLAAEFSPEA
jgi:hypothetical protein